MSKIEAKVKKKSVKGVEKKYNPQEIEFKWQRVWEEKGIYQPDLESAKRPFYNLMMFPYPSAEGLHVGSVFAFSGADIYGRFKRMQGNDVFEPIGLDGFGIHSENHAIKTGTHPMEHAKRTEKNFYRQLHSIGNGFDWRHKAETYDPHYYKWTQWLFTELFKAGLAYRKKAPVNFCPSCKTVLADEQVVEKRKAKSEKRKVDEEVIIGVCERCETVVEKRNLEQWFFRITTYAERLLNNIERLDWTEKVKIAQRNWIGRSEGARIKFQISNFKFPISNEIEVFTTRPDTLFGATFLVLSPEHPFIATLLKSKINPSVGGQKSKIEELKSYIDYAGKKSEQERMSEQREKTGLFSGVYAINPVNNEQIPVWIADYVLMGYGTGAIMAVPAHDKRDHEFAIKYNLRIKKVIDTHDEFQSLVMSKSVDYDTFSKEIIDNGMQILEYQDWGLIVTGRVDKQDKYLRIIKRHLKTGEPWYADADGSLKVVIFKDRVFKLPDENKEAKEYGRRIGIPEKQLDWQSEKSYAYCFERSGILVNSGKYNGLVSEKALGRLVADFPEAIKKEINYHLRDWLISRQRYWGPPIPMIFCQSCAEKGNSWFSSAEAKKERKGMGIFNFQSIRPIRHAQGRQAQDRFSIFNEDWDVAGWYPVPEAELPVKLPYIKDFKPLGTGKSPLANHPEFYEIKCPHCGGRAIRETDVSDTFLDSSWYFLRYLAMDWNDVPFPSVELAKNKKQEARSKEEVENWELTIKVSERRARWLPVHMYIGGAEHAVLHLLYARFITMALYDLGYISFDEPFKRFYAHGLIIKDGAKMSKSRGNVINPDEYIGKFGADTLRMYLHFLGPFDAGGDFRDTGIEGMHRFLKRVYALFKKDQRSKIKDQKLNEEALRMMHRTIAGVTEDLEHLRYNTAIAKMMSYYNFLARQETVSEEEASVYLRMLAPFAPHMAEELFQFLRSEKRKAKSEKLDSIHAQPWPSYDAAYLREDTVTIPVQVNGRLRDTIRDQRSEIRDQRYLEKKAKESDNVRRYLEGKKILKVIYVPGKVINFVVN